MKKISTVIMLAGFVGITNQVAMANEISLAISDEMIDLRLTTDYEQDFFGRLEFLHTDIDGNTADQLAFTFGTVGTLDNVNVMLGLRPYWIKAESETGYGLALGGGGSMEVAPRLFVGGEFFYTPEVLSGSDVDNGLDLALQVSFQAIENGAVFAGYRDIEIDTGAGDVDVYDSYYLGVSLSF